MNLLNRIAYHIREWRTLRVCNTPEKFAAYVKIALITPELIAYWIGQTIWYEKESNPTWFPIEMALKNRQGNCTEIACLAKFAVNLLPGYQAEIICVYGEDANRKKVAHAMCAFSTKTERGIINGSKVTHYPVGTPWGRIVADTVSDWLVSTWKFADDSGKTILVDL